MSEVIPQGSSADIDPRVLQFQLEILKDELQLVEKSITKFDEITQTTKNWAIIIWGGSLGIALGNPSLNIYVILTALLPIMFWYIDSRWRYFQRRSIYRSIKITEFLNDGRLEKSYRAGKLIDFHVYDTSGAQYMRQRDQEFFQFVTIARTWKFKEISYFYTALILISIFLGLFLILTS